MQKEIPSKKRNLKRSTDALSQLSFVGPSKQQSSIQTVLGITNSMVGSICLVIPQVFLQYGIITCTFIMIILGAIQYKTCQLLVLHLNDNDTDTEQMIKRLIGKFWANAFRLSSGTLLFVVGMIYYQLINLTLFPIIQFILIQANYTNFALPSDGITFDKFSIQWLAIIIFIPLSSMLLIRDIISIIKLAHYGVLAVCAYGVFIIYIFVNNLFDDKFKFSEITWVTSNINQPAGQFALAFMIHNAIGQLIKNNKNKENNSRDLGIAYGLSGFIYGMIGIFGAIGLQGKSVSSPSTVLDYFEPSEIAVLLIESCFLIHLVTAFPIFNFISKYQIFEVLFPKEVHVVIYWGYSVLFMCSCLAIQLLNINVGVVIAFDGAVCGFLQIYIIPIYLHMKCYYGHKDQILIQNSDSDHFDYINACNHEKRKLPIIARIVIYSGITMIGLYNLVIQFYDLVQ